MITRAWSMPNKHTFDIKPIKELLHKYETPGITIDPFANKSRFATITNDLDPLYETDYNLDALDFLKLMKDKSVDMVLYDPPYSPRQVSESYRRFNRCVNMQMTQSSYWGNHKKEISRLLKGRWNLYNMRLEFRRNWQNLRYG